MVKKSTGIKYEDGYVKGWKDFNLCYQADLLEAFGIKTSNCLGEKEIRIGTSEIRSNYET